MESLPFVSSPPFVETKQEQCEMLSSRGGQFAGLGPPKKWMRTETINDSESDSPHVVIQLNTVCYLTCYW